MRAEPKLIQNLGIVAQMFDELEIGKTIDEAIEKPKRKVSVGTAVKAMVVNALGFTGRALYLTPSFFKSRPVGLLFGEGLLADDFHDDCLGTALDALYETGITELFYKVAATALSIAGVEHHFVHLDTSTLSLYGKYEGADEEEDCQAISITQGYSKDNRPELNQVVISLICSYRSSIPLYLEALSGNSSDKKSFPETIKKFKTQLSGQKLPVFVADSALYSKPGLTNLEGVEWITRVPETLGEVKKAINSLTVDAMNTVGDGYRIQVMETSYADIPQRWIMVRSEKARERELAAFRRKLEKMTEEKTKDLWHLQNNAFACEADAVKAAKSFAKTLSLHELSYQIEKRNHYEKKGRPTQKSPVTGESFFIKGTICEAQEAVEEATKRKGVFVLATNILDESVLPSEKVLEVYKAQGISVERGFRFLKDPMFFAESLFLNSPKRIMALIMVMTLSLLVYSLTERKMRAALKEQKRTISSQVNKPTDNPTARWVFQIFEGAMLSFLYPDTGPVVVTPAMVEDCHTILECLGPEYQKMYFSGL